MRAALNVATTNLSAGTICDVRRGEGGGGEGRAGHRESTHVIIYSISILAVLVVFCRHVLTNW